MQIEMQEKETERMQAQRPREDRGLSERALQRQRQMEESGYWYLLFVYGLPSVLSALAGTLYSIVDRIFVGRGVGSDALAALAVVMTLNMIVEALVCLFTIGGYSLFSRFYGSGKLKESETVFCGMHTLATTVMLLWLIFGQLFAARLLRLAGCPEELLSLALSYYRVIIAGNFFGVLTGLMLGLLRCIGHPKVPLVSVVLSQGTNVVLDWVFIFLFGWGVAGAAWATVIGMVVGFVFSVCMLWGKLFPYTALEVRDFVPRWKQVGEMVMIGLSPFTGILGFSFMLILFNRYAGAYYGGDGLAAIATFTTLDNLLYMMVGGLWNGLVGLCSYNYGAKLYRRVKGLTNRAILMSTVYLCLSFLVAQLAAPWLTTPFLKPGSRSFDMAVQGMRWGYLFMWTAGVSWAITYLLDALGRYWVALITAAVQPLLFGVLLRPFVARWGWKGLFLSFSVLDLFKALMGGVVLWWLYRWVMSEERRTEGGTLIR